MVVRFAVCAYKRAVPPPAIPHFSFSPVIRAGLQTTMQLEIPIFSFLLLGLLPLPIYYHLQMRIASTIIFIFWIVTLNLIYAVNTITWDGNVDVVASPWCDICQSFHHYIFLYVI